jgi:predicted dehydrogenase
VADQFHVPLCRQALAAGKPVLIEKPLGVTVEECEELRDLVTRTGLVFQVGNNRRFEPGMTEARRFLREEAGDLLNLDAWYYDSVYRYTMQDNLYPVPVESANVKRPAGDWKANRQRYLMITHGVHLLDTARFLDGPLVAVQARHHAHREMHGWSIQVEFASGAVGNLSLISPRCGDFEEGFRVHGTHGSVVGQRAVAAVARLERLPVDRPLADLGAAAAIRVPTLVLAHQQDPIHQFAFGARLAAAIPGAKLVVLTPKSIDRERHAAEAQRCLEAFLGRFTAPGPSSRATDAGDRGSVLI